MPIMGYGRGSCATMALLAISSFCIFANLLLSCASPAATAGPWPRSAYRGYKSPYSFDADRALFPSWMAAVPDSASLASLAIPGTHDTLTSDMSERVFQCQNHDLPTQLRAGVRYIDVRARLHRDELLIYHGNRWTGHTYADVLLHLFDFLEANPSEALVVRLKEEGFPMDGNPPEPGGNRTTRSFEQAFNHYRQNDSRTAEGCARHLFQWPAEAPTISTPLLPTMGSLRGKILLLQNFPSTRGRRYGVPWKSPLLRLEDLWIIPNVTHLETKWAAIEGNLAAAARDASSGNASDLYLTHLSASVGVTPIEAAAGPLAPLPNGTRIRGMNDRTAAWLSGTAPARGAGVVIADFPGRGLVESILARNDWLTLSGRPPGPLARALR